MKCRQPASTHPGISHKKEVLSALYDVYSDWVKRFPLVCRKGCATCCTQSVTMSSLEAEVILDFIKRGAGEKWLLARLATAVQEDERAGMTTNQFAGACLLQQEIDGDIQGSWNFTPCVFLEENVCLIYKVRPFGCRSFGSLQQCGPGRAAEITSRHLAVNTVFTQIIEHLSSDGGYWSKMTAVLAGLADSGPREVKVHLRSAYPVPGFLLETYEVPVVRELLQQVSAQLSARKVSSDLIDNFLSIL
jgi:Fe-S-cluster containining protein